MFIWLQKNERIARDGSDRTGVRPPEHLIYDRSVMAGMARLPNESASAKTDTTARTELPVQPPGEVERRELDDAQEKTEPVMPAHTAAGISPSGYLDREEIARLAYRNWLDRQGRDDGSAEDDWVRAEHELRRRSGKTE